ncbi:uncharacterized protein [Epargyreus clarus]|uniref:uncharacterized protein n=1 Tax=Epargyreus clarus TaxID=520877 RepID=UPI003C2BCB88
MVTNNNNENNGYVASSSGNANGETNPTPLVSCFAKDTVQQQVLLATALVEATSRNGVGYKVRALLDQGSQSSFVTESTAQYLGLNKTLIKGKITGLGGDKQIISKAMITIEIKSLINSDVRIPVKAYVLKNITSLLPTRKVEKLDWPELKELVLADPQFDVPNHIDLLLGAETYSQILQEGMKKGPFGNLIAQATSFGWILSGMVNPSNDPISQIQVMHCCTESNDMLKRFWELESDQRQPKETMFTDNEKRCEQYFKETTQRDEDGRYIVRLPFRNGTPEVTASREIAEKRLKLLENRLNKNKTMKATYQEVIEEYLHLDHMEVVPKDEIDNDKSIYLPHHAVVKNDRQTTKVRIVYDASCKGKNNLSLNDQLLVGPKLQPELRCIVMQWRISPICMSADIAKMYRQIKVNQRDADCQRILWRENDKEEIKSYRLTRVTFGTASAPYLAVKALQQVAHDHGVNYPSAAENILKHFYVDDLMTGVNSVEEGKTVYKEMNELLSKAGFELQKWRSNSDELLKVMKSIETKGDNTGNLKIQEDDITKIMGLTWDRSEDSFRYVVNLPELKKPVTKRRIISDISRLYDPLGWVGPSIIIAKIIIQKLWLAALDWDDKVPDNILNEWLTYREEQTNFNKLRIPRWHGTNVNEICREIHGFCDASKVAYAAAVYLRVLDSAGKVTVTLVTAKTKVAPVKVVSIPRLELCGAVLLTKLLLEVAQVMNVEKHNIHAWTDSTVVLAWLNDHPSKWNVFVANRVSEILNNLEPTTWCHVSSKQNPADGASRGLHPLELVNNQLWFHGPDFISREPIIYLRPKEVQTEMEVLKTHCATLEESTWDKYSSLTKTVRVMAYCRRFIVNCNKTRGPKITINYLTAKELRDTLTIWIKECQSNNFNDEIKLVKENKNLPKGSKLKTLNPFLDNDGVLRVGGRLSHSRLNINKKHPIIIPRQSHLTELIISDAHKQTLHGGLQLTLAYILSKYWILGGKQLIKSHNRQCVTCVKNSAVTRNPLMGQMPAARVTPTRPFSHSGVDYAGPIQIRTTKGRGHKSHKGYICLFICMATRAIHLEVVTDLTTEGFLQAFKRFVARRGNCSQLWSDNGTNFVGAATELQKRSSDEYRRMHQEVAEALAINHCEWHFIPPHSPNFGGLWEAGVKSVKYHLKRVVGNSTLTYEEMATVLAQIEACLNSRPMLALNDQPDDFTVLTPGHFLIGEPPVAAPDYDFEKSNVSSLRRWQHTQRMLQTFWRQWSQEYLTKFLHRYKWTDRQSQPSLGDVVVIKEDHLPPCRWLYGLITATHPGEDKVVRVVSLKTKTGILKRPVSKLCFLPIEK